MNLPSFVFPQLKQEASSDPESHYEEISNVENSEQDNIVTDNKLVDTSSAISVDKKEDGAVTDTNLVDTSTDTRDTKKVDTDVGVEDTTEAALTDIQTKDSSCTNSADRKVTDLVDTKSVNQVDTKEVNLVDTAMDTAANSSTGSLVDINLTSQTDFTIGNEAKILVEYEHKEIENMEEAVGIETNLTSSSEPLVETTKEGPATHTSETLGESLTMIEEQDKQEETEALMASLGVENNPHPREIKTIGNLAGIKYLTNSTSDFEPLLPAIYSIPICQVPT